MNEYTYEVWSSYNRKITDRGWSEYEFCSLKVIRAADATEALLYAKKEIKSDEEVQYQVRNLKKI